ncbi:MAG: hypothetical protein JO102_05695, partial [Elusimicrobia bacterium]|nr:hypothetical protein [Elusimicrobiota bacterium]
MLESLRRFRAAGLAVAVAAAAVPALAAAPKFMPPDDKILVIMGQDVPNVTDYLAAVKIPPAGVAAYTSVMEAEGLSEPADHGGGVQHAEKLLEECPHSVLQLAVYMVDACQKVAAGDLDA